jgi:hypothetical protein
VVSLNLLYFFLFSKMLLLGENPQTPKKNGIFMEFFEE